MSIENKRDIAGFELQVGEISDLMLGEEYKKLWENINLPIQINKGRQHRLEDNQLQKCLGELSKRAFYLVSLAKYVGAKNIVEVGTGHGWQFFSFAEFLKSSESGGHDWSCDINDVRHQEYVEKYREYTTFCLGNSEKLASKILGSESKIDLFYIDGAHGYGDVIRDVYHLRKTQSDNPVWVFDDFDSRFGCYRDINSLMKINKNFKIYRVGSAASGNPNHQVMMFGKL